MVGGNKKLKTLKQKLSLCGVNCHILLFVYVTSFLEYWKIIVLIPETCRAALSGAFFNWTVRLGYWQVLPERMGNSGGRKVFFFFFGGGVSVLYIYFLLSVN